MSVSIGSIVKDTMITQRRTDADALDHADRLVQNVCIARHTRNKRRNCERIRPCFPKDTRSFETGRAGSRRVQSRATADAMRFAVMLPPHAISEHTIINPPHRHTGRISFSGIRSSMIYDKIHGIASSQAYRPPLKLMPTPIRAAKTVFKYTASLFSNYMPLFPLRSSQ